MKKKRFRDYITRIDLLNSVVDKYKYENLSENKLVVEARFCIISLS